MCYKLCRCGGVRYGLLMRKYDHAVSEVVTDTLILLAQRKPLVITF